MTSLRYTIMCCLLVVSTDALKCHHERQIAGKPLDGYDPPYEAECPSDGHYVCGMAILRECSVLEDCVYENACVDGAHTSKYEDSTLNANGQKCCCNSDLCNGGHPNEFEAPTTSSSQATPIIILQQNDTDSLSIMLNMTINQTDTNMEALILMEDIQENGDQDSAACPHTVTHCTHTVTHYFIMFISVITILAL